MSVWQVDPERIDALSDAKIVLDCIERVGETKVSRGPITTMEVPSFIRNRYPKEISSFIQLLMEAKRLKSIPQLKEKVTVHE